MPLSPVSLATIQILSFSLCVCITFLKSQGDEQAKTGNDLCEGRVEKAGVGTGEGRRARIYLCVTPCCFFNLPLKSEQGKK